MIVVETVEMNSSSSPRLCIFSSLAIIDTPGEREGGKEGGREGKIKGEGGKEGRREGGREGGGERKGKKERKGEGERMEGERGSQMSHVQSPPQSMPTPLLVSKTFSALLGSPSQDGVWVSGRDSTHCTNCSRLEKPQMITTSNFPQAKEQVGIIMHRHTN